MTTLITIRRKGQITLPRHLRAAIGLAEGGMVNISIRDGKIVITPWPVIVQDREPATLSKALTLLRRDARRKGTNKMTMRQINSEIAAARHEKRAKKKIE